MVYPIEAVFASTIKGSSTVKLTVAYSIPSFLGKLMDGLFLGRIVESTIQADMNRFREYAMAAQQQQHAQQ